MTDCLYRRLAADGDEAVFESTDGTRSNWDPRIQHGSPPLALLTKTIEELAAGTGLRIARLALDILGAIPVAPVRVRAWVDRPGTRISLMVAEMRADLPDGTRRTVARVSAWLIAPSDTRDVARPRYAPLVEGPDTGLSHAWAGAPGYLETVSWRKQPTPDGAAAEAWMSPLVPLVDSEPTTAVQRLAMVVDSGNGIGAALDPQRFVFMNTDTVVHLQRLPEGDDFGVRALGSIGPDGIGVTTAEVFDRTGFVGTCAQTLLVQRLP
ncbi:thioesterase family protein [Mycobacterium sp. pV006]|uniref:thioesterase family protein n=1 Tax=Mycobacterium sp. pV006 TaxID=3238983 RepID=UPI00351AB591